MEYDCLYPLLHLDDNWKRWDGGKVGGLPIWLDKRRLPRKEQLMCSTCEQMSASPSNILSNWSSGRQRARATRSFRVHFIARSMCFAVATGDALKESTTAQRSRVV